LDHELDRLDWNAWLQNFLQWPEVVGWGFAHIWWDPDAGDKVGDDNDGALFKGEVCLEICQPSELSVDPSSLRTDMEAARRCIRTTTMTTETAWERYNVSLGGGTARSLA